jgi:PAS domain S-box-containing protein
VSVESIFSSDTICIDKDQYYKSIGSNLFYLEDKHSNYTFDEIISGKYNQYFQKSEQEIPYFGYKKTNYWLYFTLKNETAKPKHIFIEYSYPLLYKIAFFKPDSTGEITVQYSGNGIDFNERPHKEAANLFDIFIEPNSVLTLYSKVESEGIDITIPISVSSPSEYQHRMKRQFFFNGFYYGLIVLMVLINLFYFINLKDNAYLYYILYVLTLGFYLLSRDGIAFEYFWPNSPVWANNADVTFALSSIIFMTLFVQNTLLTNIHQRLLHKIMNISIGVYIFIILLSIIIRPLYPIGNFVVLISIILVFTVAIPSLKQNIPIAIYFLIGASFLAIGLLLYVTKNFGFISFYKGEYAVKVFSAIDIVVLSFGLTVRFKSMFERSKQMAIDNLKKLNRLKDKINLQLEKEVKKRTSELQKQRDDLEIANISIHKQKDEIESQKELLEISNLELEQLSLVARETDSAIAIFNSKYDVEWLNRGFTKLYGLTFSEIIDTKGKKITNISDNTEINLILEEINTKKESIVYNTQCKSKDGKKIWVRTTLTPIFDDNGKLDKLIAIDSDITKLKIAEQEIKQREEEIRAQRDEIEKQNKDLEKAYIKVKESAELKEIFLANTSHEIRTPLNGIIGFTNLLLKSRLTEKQLSYLQNIKTSGDNLLVVIDDILDFSKIEAGKLSLEKVEFDLRKTMDQVLKTLKIKANEKEIDLVNNIGKNIPSIIIGDPVRTNQVFINLLGNAIKFTPDKGKVEFGAKLVKESKSFVEIEFKVSDNGIGISQEKIESVFQSFTQAKSDTTRKFGGTGLGLSIVKRLIDIQKGEIKIDSEVNKGTTFTILIQYEKRSGKYKLIDDDEPFKLEKCHPDKIRILLVEDNEINQTLAVDTIKQWYDKTIIDVAPNGQIAVELFNHNHYNLVLMDIQMPVMDGYDTTVFMRNQFEKPKCDTPIVAMTAHAMKQEKDKCLDIGMNDYLSKPFSPNALFDKLKSWTCHKVADLIKEGKPVDITKIKCEFQPAKVVEEKVDNSEIEKSFRYVDISKLLNIYKSDVKKIKKILSLYLKSIPNELDELHGHIQNENWNIVKPKAHTIKTKMGYIGLEIAQQNMKTIELQSVESPDKKEFLILFDQVIEAWDKAFIELAEFI